MLNNFKFCFSSFSYFPLCLMANFDQFKTKWGVVDLNIIPKKEKEKKGFFKTKKSWRLISHIEKKIPIYKISLYSINLVCIYLKI